MTFLSVLHARGGQMTSGAIAERFDCAWPTTPQHLRVLEQAGLVTITMRVASASTTSSPTACTQLPAAG